MLEETVTIQNDKVNLEGTLTTPDNEQPKMAVLLIADSGPLDRNQNSAKVQLNLFNTVAEHLALAGIASLRYDKRGCGNSTGNYDAAGHSDLVSDAGECLKFLRKHSAINGAPLLILGHGEGTLIAPQLIAQNDDINGQVLLSPYVENYASMIHRQAEKALGEISSLTGFKGKLIRFFLAVSGDQMVKQKKLIARIRKSSKSVIKIKKQVINAKWIREMVDLDAVVVHQLANVPTLAIGGEKDLQSLPGDIEKLKDVITGPLETHVIPDLTHILRTDSEEPSTQHYLQLSIQPVDSRVLETTTHWLLQQV